MPMRTGKDAHRDDVDILLECCFSNLLRRLAKARVNDLEARVAQCTCDDLRAAVMSVKTRFRY